MNLMHAYYQKGYKDGYNRHKVHIDSQREEEISYMYNTMIVIIIFVVFIAIIVYTYGVNSGINSLYKGDCLLDIATTYQPHHCLDN